MLIIFRWPFRHQILWLSGIIFVSALLLLILARTGPKPIAYTHTASKLKIIVDTHYMTLLVLQPGKHGHCYPVAVGKPRTPSPIGCWRVIEKEKWGGEFGTHWIGLNVPFGFYGIHGTDNPESIGKNHSHGCIRMYNKDVAHLYELIRIGTQVHIIGDPFVNKRRLLRGQRGSDVLFLQRRLKQLGFFHSIANGIFDRKTEKAVIRFQRRKKLPITGQIRMTEYRMLRLCGEEYDKLTE